LQVCRKAGGKAQHVKIQDGYPLYVTRQKRA
jgi:hypothetical protein